MARPRTHDDALRARLLEVTSEVISTSGSDAVRVREVARAAGTSASAVYALFGSREALVDAVSREAVDRFAGHLAGVPRTADPAGDLLALGRAYRASALADPHFYRVMFDRLPDPEVPVAGRPTFRVLRDAVARVVAAGAPEDLREASGPDDDARVDGAALALWSLVHGLVSLELVGLLPGAEAGRARRYDAVLTAVGPALLGAPEH